MNTKEFFISLFIFLLIFAPSVNAGIAVQALGQADLDGGNMAEAEEKALQNSLTAALEKSLKNLSGRFDHRAGFSSAKEKIFANPEPYIQTYETVRKWRQENKINLKLNVTVNTERLENDFRAMLQEVSEKLNHPVIAFLLTAHEIDKVTRLKKHIEGQILIDAFQQQFVSNGFDVIAADEAREFAAKQTGRLAQVVSGDRRKIAGYAYEVGANFVSRGELQVTYKGIDNATGANMYAGTISCEIIESATKEVVAAFSDTVTKKYPDKAQALSAIMKSAAQNAARTLALQTLDKWIAMTKDGYFYIIRVEKVKSHRNQGRKIEQALAKHAKIIRPGYNRKEKTLTLDVSFKGTGQDIEDILFDDPALQSYKNFDLIKSSGNRLVFSF